LNKKIGIEVGKTELKILQFNLILWTVIALTLAIAINFPDMEDISSKKIDGLEMIIEIKVPHQILMLIMASVIAVPITYSFNRFYNRHLKRFIKAVDNRNIVK